MHLVWKVKRCTIVNSWLFHCWWMYHLCTSSERFNIHNCPVNINIIHHFTVHEYSYIRTTLFPQKVNTISNNNDKVFHLFSTGIHNRLRWMFLTKKWSFFVYVFVRLFVNMILVSSKWLNIGRWNLVGRCIVQKSRPSLNFRVIGPILEGPHPQNMTNQSFHKM